MDGIVSELEGRSRAALQQIELLLLYEDLPTGLRARRALDRVLSRPELMAEGLLHPWRLDTLGDPQCREQAALDALTAEIVMLSMHGGNHLPLVTETSLEEWFGSKTSKGRVLVISFDLDAKPLIKTNPTATKLGAIAARNGVAMILHFGEPWSGESATMSEAARRTSTEAEVLRRAESPPHWGINE